MNILFLSIQITPKKVYCKFKITRTSRQDRKWYLSVQRKQPEEEEEEVDAPHSVMERLWNSPLAGTGVSNWNINEQWAINGLLKEARAGRYMLRARKRVKCRAKREESEHFVLMHEARVYVLPTICMHHDGKLAPKSLRTMFALLNLARY